MKLDSKRIWLWGSLALALAVPPLLLRASSTEQQRLNEGRTSIKNLTKSGQERLKREFADYVKMDEAERDRYRRLHAALQNDRDRDQGKYQQALDDYYAWLKTIPVQQQEDLKKATDPAERIKVMERVVEEQKERKSDEAAGVDTGARRSFWGPQTPVLTSDELAAVMLVVEQQARLTPSQASEVEPLTGFRKYAKLLSFLARGQGRSRLTDADEERILAAIPTRNVPEWSLPPERGGPQQGPRNEAELRRNKLFYVLRSALFAECRRESNRHDPTEDNLRAFFQELPPEEQVDLLELTPVDFDQALRQKNLAATHQLDFRVVLEMFPPPPGVMRGFGRSGGEGPRGDPGRMGRPNDGDGRRPPFGGSDDGRPRTPPPSRDRGERPPGAEPRDGR